MDLHAVGCLLLRATFASRLDRSVSLGCLLGQVGHRMGMGPLAAFRWLALLDAVVCCLVAIGMGGASGCDEGDVGPAKGFDTETLVDRLLFGGGRCVQDQDCASSKCSVGVCVGFLMLPSAAGRLRMLPLLREAVRSDERTGKRMLRILQSLLDRTDSDPFLRGRACAALQVLGEKGAELARKQLEDPHEAVRFFCAWALARLGDRDGLRVLSDFFHHPSAKVRLLARAVWRRAGTAEEGGKDDEGAHGHE